MVNEPTSKCWKGKGNKDNGDWTYLQVLEYGFYAEHSDEQRYLNIKYLKGEGGKETALIEYKIP